MTLRFAVIGRPIAHSLSPAMHSAALAALGLDATYVAREVAPHELPAIVGELRDGTLAGANVTIPHKVAIAALCDRLEVDARTIGAVNTISLEAGAVVGTNTDVVGLLASLAPHEAALRGRGVVILGAGGAARAAVAVARRLEAHGITIVARRPEEARVLGADLSVCALADRAAIAAVFEEAALVVQASSATMTSSTSTAADAAAFVEALPLETLSSSAVVTDLVYRPRRTALLDACEARGLTTIDGTEMLVQQGAASLAGWLGRDVASLPIDAMRRAVHDAL